MEEEEQVLQRPGEEVNVREQEVAAPPHRRFPPRRAGPSLAEGGRVTAREGVDV